MSRATLLLLLLGLTGFTATAAALELPEKERDRRGLTTANHVSRLFQMDRNRVIMLLTDVAEIGSAGSSVGGGGFWITTQNQYIFSSGINLGAEIPNGDGDGNQLDTALMIGGPFSQLQYGSVEFPEFPSASGLGTGATASAGVFWANTNAEDAADFPEVCSVDAFRQQLFPSLSPFAGEPFPGFADQTVCYAGNDITGGVCADCGGKRLGAEVVLTTFAFGVPSVQDFVFAAIRVFNRSEFITAENSPSNAAGPYTFQNAVLGFAIDPDVGDSGDDQITFFPDIGTMVYWDSDFSEPTFIGTPGFGAVSVFPVPDPETGESFSLESFTLFVRGTIRPDPESPQEWYEGLTGDPSFVAFEVQPTDIRGMTSTNRFDLEPGAFVELYAAYFFANVAGTPPASLLAENPFQADNRTPRPGANDDPAFDDIVRVQQTAQATIDAGFVVPTAPPKPEFSLIPGDQEVTIVWEGDPIEAVNPFAKVARDPFVRLTNGEPDPDAEGQGIILAPGQVVFIPERDQGGTTGFVTASEAGLAGREVTNPAFDADFVVQDFQGFRVYRSFTGSTEDAELIFQVDQNDAITGGVFCTAAVTVRDDDGNVVQNVCTAQAQLDIGTNTGLGFSVTDRGGSAPTPSVGPGLINGIPVFYTVTSFAVNTGQSPVTLPEGTSVLPGAAPLVLESGLQPLRSATPRTNASSFVGANVGDAVALDGAGQPVGDPGDIPVDGEGNLTGPIPAPGDFSASVNVVQPAAIPSDFEVQVHIDGMPLSSAWNTGFCPVPTANECLFSSPGPFDDLPAGDGRGVMMILRVTDGAGNVLQTPTGPAEDIRAAFGPLNFQSGGTAISSPVIPILAPDDPSAGVAFTVQYSTTMPPRADNCALNGLCEVQSADGGGTPASLAASIFDRKAYAMPVVSDVELTWSNQGGVLSLSSVRNVSANTAMDFSPDAVTDGWGFARASRMPGAEGDFLRAAGVPSTSDGRYLFPQGLCTDGGSTFGDFAGCDAWGLETGFTQGAPIWSDLPVGGDIFSRLTAGIYLTDFELMQSGALAQEAALVMAEGLPATRLSLAGQWVNLQFNSLPADGETWLVRFPTGGDSSTGVSPSNPRPLVPGMAVSIPLAGGTNELADADLSQVSVVPNPFFVGDALTRGDGREVVMFTNLPPRATIRIYTISGNLVRILEHTGGDGTEEWDVRTRFDLLAASGNYYYHVTTPDGRTHLGRLAVVN